MILSELNKLILDVAGSNYLVNQAYVGDVYEINAKENRFGCFVATPMTANKNTAGTITYTYVMYYIDRLTKDESNIDLVQTDAMTVLTGLIGWLQDQSGVLLDIGIDTTYTLFRQKFDDWCAGAWLQVSLVVPDSLCGDYDFNYIGGEIRPLYATSNGTYNPAPGTGFGPVYVSVSGGGVSPEWVDNEIDTKLSGYATQSWCTSKFPDKRELNDYATRSWVLSKNYASESWVSSQIIDAGLGLQGWVRNQNYVSDQWVYGKKYATQSWVSNAISGLAAMSWVESQGYLTSEALMGYATESWVQSQGYLTEVPDNYATKKYVADAIGSCEAAVQSWVSDQEFLNSASLTGYATKSWVSSQQFATQSWVTTAISGLAAMSWVSDQHFLTSASLMGYATESWVQSQGYLTSHQDLSSYATKSWATSEFFEESKIWTGTSAQWNQLTSAKKATYTIALITE